MAVEDYSLQGPMGSRHTLLKERCKRGFWRDPLYWEGVRAEVAEPLEAELLAAEAAAPDAAARRLERAVADTRALGSLACANPACMGVVLCPPGGLQVKAARGKKCSQCQAVRYCGPACQKSHWQRGGHKAPCRELQRQLLAAAQ